ncbi:MAG: polyphenol oxidase family protein [Verrucomicrobiota bacterium]
MDEIFHWRVADTRIPSEFSPVLVEAGVVGGFAIRQPGVEVAVERHEALDRLRPVHLELQKELGLQDHRLCLAEQVHGTGIAHAAQCADEWFPAADALITADPSVCLGIYVADCCAVYLVDIERRAIGLVHSGAKGTRLGIVPKTVDKMGDAFGTRPESVVVVLSPCIRPPFYEVDFAAEIRTQCKEIGIQRVVDSGVCTGAGMDRYYSYRREQGKTGRMLALLALSV